MNKQVYLKVEKARAHTHTHTVGKWSGPQGENGQEREVERVLHCLIQYYSPGKEDNLPKFFHHKNIIITKSPQFTSKFSVAVTFSIEFKYNDRHALVIVVSLP